MEEFEDRAPVGALVVSGVTDRTEACCRIRSASSAESAIAKPGNELKVSCSTGRQPVCMPLRSYPCDPKAASSTASRVRSSAPGLPPAFGTSLTIMIVRSASTHPAAAVDVVAHPAISPAGNSVTARTTPKAERLTLRAFSRCIPFPLILAASLDRLFFRATMSAYRVIQKNICRPAMWTTHYHASPFHNSYGHNLTRDQPAISGRDGIIDCGRFSLDISPSPGDPA